MISNISRQAARLSAHNLLKQNNAQIAPPALLSGGSGATARPVATAPRLYRSASTQAQPLAVPNAAPLPTIRDVREWLLEHAIVVYGAENIEFDPTRKHDRSIGLQQALIPLQSQQAQTWRTYSHNKKMCRFGVVLEELDILATYIGYKHNQDPNVSMLLPGHHTIGVVTARVDRIDVAPGAEFRADQDILMTGYVSWQGKSSMEVTMHVEQGEVAAGEPLRPLLTAKFVMVTISGDGKSGAPNVPLVINNEAEQNDFDNGEQAKNHRAIRDKTSVLKVAPTDEEDAIIRELTMPTLDQLSLSPSRMPLASGKVWMEQARHDTVMMCYPEQTNCHGFVFGGYLLREAYDIAWANIANFSKRLPVCQGVTDVLFRAPVAVNSLLHYNSQVCYTDGRFAEVSVDAVVENVEKDKFQTSNTFHFTFDTLGEMPQLIPRTYSDGLRFLNARREFLYFKNKN